MVGWRKNAVVPWTPELYRVGDKRRAFEIRSCDVGTGMGHSYSGDLYVLYGQSINARLLLAARHLLINKVGGDAEGTGDVS